MQSKLTSVVAPAGFGKSLLLRQWSARRDSTPIAWLTCDPQDNNGGRFAARLVAALAIVDGNIGKTAMDRVDGSGRTMGDHFIAQLLEDLEPVGPAILVLDELDTLTNASLLMDLRALIENSPTGLNVLIASRVNADPLQLGLQMTTLDHGDLAFDRDETALLLERLSARNPTDRQLDDLFAKTEGWPAAVQLSGLALRDGSDPDDFIEGLNGNDPFIGGYLTKEVLANQPTDLHRFLLETSILRQFTEALCDAVTGAKDGREMLHLVRSKSMFLMQVDDHGEWFRYHRLFRDHTRHELRGSSTDLERRLLCRAADWHLARDEIDTAASYLVEAEDWDRVLDIVATYGRDRFERGDSATVLRWLSSVPAGIRAASTEAMLQEAVLQTAVGNCHRAEGVVAQLTTAAAPSAGELIVIDAIRATWVQWHGSTPSGIAAATAALEALDTVPAGEVPNVFGMTAPDSVRDIAGVSRARAFWYDGETVRAREALEAMAERSEAFAPWAINVLGARALLDAWDGRLHDAHQVAARALVLASRSGLVGHQCTVDALLAMAEVLRERGSLGRSALLLEQALGPSARTQRSVPLAIYALERGLLDLAESEAQRGVLRIAAFLAAGHGTPPPAIAARLGAVDARLRMALGDEVAASRIADSTVGLWSADQAAVAVQFAAENGQITAVRAMLETWPDGGLRSTIDQLLWTSVVDEAEGDHRAARQGVSEVLALAEPEGYVRLFVDAGPTVHRLLRRSFEANPTPYLRRLLQTAEGPQREPGGKSQSTKLSERELEVLRFLPTRLSNAEIATSLYVSLNTIKTHLRSIYRGLGVTGRRQAVEHAERAGIL